MVPPAAQTTSSYRVQVASELDRSWATTLDGWQLATARGRTTLERRDVDQAALYGLLMRLRDLGLVLLAVERLESSE